MMAVETVKGFPLRELVRLLDARLEGDPQRVITGLASPEQAGPDEIAYIAAGRRIDCSRLHAAALILDADSPVSFPNRLLVADPQLAFAFLLELFQPRVQPWPGIHPTAVMDQTVVLGADVSIGPYAVIGSGTRIGDRTEIHAAAIIYPHVSIGSDCLLYTQCVIREQVEIGDRVIVHPGVVLGADGFGFARDAKGVPIKIPQKGCLKIGNDCEIGANSCIDRSTLEETVLSDHVKLDNLVQIGHNVRVGQRTMISAQTGISGSARIGADILMGGQVGIGDHLEIADGVMIAGKTGVTGSIKKKMTVSGYPHQEIGQWRRTQVLLRHLADLRDQVQELKKKINKLEGE